MFDSITHWLFKAKHQPQYTRHRGLYYPPEGGEVYESHRAWVGAQQFGSNSVMALALVATNPAVHRCRIGKITLKLS